MRTFVTTTLRVERSREFGHCYLGLALWHRLGLSKVLGELIEPGDEEVPWPIVASILTVVRFCAQPSELGIAQHWYQRTALEDLTGVPWDKVDDDRLYRGLDVLGKHKDRLCTHLMERDQWSELVHGAYLLRTNCTERDPAQLWKWYVQLTQAEAAFRTAKSDLGLRPVYHQLACRVEAHILVCFLALAMWRTLEHWNTG